LIALLASHGHGHDGLDGNVETLIVGLLLTALIAVFVYVGCRAAGRPDWAATGAAATVIVGALLTLLYVL
jgi:hypothetical protein